MHYEINVSLDGYHFFATHERSITSKEKLKKLKTTFQEKFPKSEGYMLSFTRYETRGYLENDLTLVD